MMRAEPREEDQNANILLRNGMMIGVDKGKQPKEEVWARKALEKEVSLGLNHAKVTFMESNKNFVKASASGS